MVMRGLYFDTATLYYRAFFAVPESIVAPDGSPSGAVRGFLDMVSTLHQQFPSEVVVFAWDDDWRPQWRVDLVPSYKTHRLENVDEQGISIEEVPDALSPQVEAIAGILDAIGLPRIGEMGFEADDILGSLVDQYDIPADVVTGDRDLFQLVDDGADVRVISITKGVKKLEVFDDQALVDKYGIVGHHYADFSLLRGDASDGLPGVKGIGEKTAAKLISEHKTVVALLDAANDETSTLAPAVRKNLIASSDYIHAATQVVRTRTDASLPGITELPKEVHSPEMLGQLVDQWGITRQVGRLLKTMQIAWVR
jgi:5'-3' exonuclease